MMFSNIHKQTSPFMLSKKTQQQNNDNNSTKSTYYGINKHDYRYTIIDFKILDKNYSESVSESRIG
jgi:hypothetical protein